jgi:DNA-binding CsgD family transcriptional regulator
MLAEQVATWNSLQQIVAGVTTDLTLREDLMQEALIHLWQREEHCPGQTECWYMQSCRFHISNFLRHGRSLDSWKHRQARLFFPGTNEWLETPTAETAASESPLGLVSVREIIALLSKWLTATETKVLDCLADGLSAREISRRLNISHTMVNRHRRGIATIALKFGIAL